MKTTTRNQGIDNAKSANSWESGGSDKSGKNKTANFKLVFCFVLGFFVVVVGKKLGEALIS